MVAAMAEEITCRITPWYTKRMSLMTVMFVGFGLYFFYDGFIGYPKKNKIFREHERFMKIQEEKETFLAESGTNVEWADVVEEKGYPAQSDWVGFAAENGWPEEPPEKIHTTEDQFFFGTLCVGIGLVVLGTMFANRKRVLRADVTSLTTPKGERVPFASAFRVDQRKWDHKGLAYVYYREGEGKVRRAIIDDLKFGGADAIRKRLLANFDGDLVERLPATDEPSPKGGTASENEEKAPGGDSS